MKIKKPMNTKAPGAEGAVTGGATIADRFRLDTADMKPKGPTVNAKAAAAAFSVAALALALLGVLVYTMYQHAEYLLNV